MANEDQTILINGLTSVLIPSEIKIFKRSRYHCTDLSSYGISIFERRDNINNKYENLESFINFIKSMKNDYSYHDIKIFSNIIKNINKNSRQVLKLNKGRYYFSNLSGLLIEGVDKLVAQGMVSNSEWVSFDVEIVKNATCIYFELAFENSCIINSSYNLEFYIDNRFIASASASWIQDNQVKLYFPPSLVSTCKKISVRIPPIATSYLTDVFEKPFYLLTLFRVIGIE